MTLTKNPPVTCSVCGRTYGQPWIAGEPGTERAAILTGWVCVDGIWWCNTSAECKTPPALTPLVYRRRPGIVPRGNQGRRNSE